MAGPDHSIRKALDLPKSFFGPDLPAVKKVWNYQPYIAIWTKGCVALMTHLISPTVMWILKYILIKAGEQENMPLKEFTKDHTRIY